MIGKKFRYDEGELIGVEELHRLNLRDMAEDDSHLDHGSLFSWHCQTTAEVEQ
jgi:hypothetical protein